MLEVAVDLCSLLLRDETVVVFFGSISVFVSVLVFSFSFSQFWVLGFWGGQGGCIVVFWLIFFLGQLIELVILIVECCVLSSVLRRFCRSVVCQQELCCWIFGFTEVLESSCSSSLFLGFGCLFVFVF